MDVISSLSRRLVHQPLRFLHFPGFHRVHVNLVKLLGGQAVLVSFRRLVFRTVSLYLLITDPVDSELIQQRGIIEV